MPEIEIYKGAYLSYQSERATLNALLQILSAKQCDAVVIANAELGGRQIDFIVAMERRAWLIEAKSANSPLRGTANGPWQYQVAAGGWKSFDNPYRQAVDAKNALRDEMRRHCGSEPSYIDAVVVFAPGIPAGSSIFYGDFKASVLGLSDLHEAFRGPQKDHWSLDQWRSFVKVHGFSRVENPEATFDPHMSSAEGIIEEYLAAFRATYEPMTHAYFSYAAKADECPRDLDDWIQRGASGDCLFFHGPSGCGKSVLGYRISLRALESGRLPIILQGKNFDGDFGALVNAELGLLDVPSAQALFRATRILNYPIVLVVDGYNECDIKHRERFLRGIAALSRRYKSNIVVSSQKPIEENNRLNLQSVFVPPPDMSVKRNIAENYAAGHSIDDVVDLLASVLSGLEARLVGEVGRTLRPGASKFQLFDAFVRQRLQSQATRGIAALTRVAHFLATRVAFGLSIRELERLSEEEGIPEATVEHLQANNLLVRRGDRVTFGHELFLNAFSAEALIREARNNVTALLAAIHAPQNKGRQTLIVGAIDDEAVIEGVVEGIEDSSLLTACLDGHCGLTAKQIAARIVDDTLQRIPQEIQDFGCQLDPSGWLGVSLSAQSENQWTPAEAARLAAVGARMGCGHNFEKVLSLISDMDSRMLAEFTRLRDAAVERNVALRTGIFANVYVQSRQVGVGLICQGYSVGFGSVDKVGEDLIMNRLREGGLSNGQLYLLIAMHRHTSMDAPGLASLLPHILQTRWRGAPYHLKLDLLQAALFCARDDDKDKAALLATLQNLPQTDSLALSTSLVEAMTALGGFDDSEGEFLEMARSDLKEILADIANPLMAGRANAAWHWRFEDGPYTAAYCESIGELPPADKRVFMEAVGRGADDEGMFINILILELAEYNDASLAPIIGRWTALPPTRCAMQQDAVRNYATAHIALARLGVELPSAPVQHQSDSAEALYSVANILYWLNRIDVTVQERRERCSALLKPLLHHARGVSAGVLSAFYNVDIRIGDKLPGDEPIQTCIGSAYPMEVAEICRDCLTNPVGQRGYFDTTFKGDILEFCQNALGSWGERSDLILLRKNVNDRRLGFSALSAIETLETHLAAPTGTDRTPFRNARVIGI